MGKFTRALKTLDSVASNPRKSGHDAVNVSGGLAFQIDSLSALYRQVATSLWSGDGYYEKQAQWLARFQLNVAEAMESDPRFPFQLAAFARDRKTGLSLRTSPVALYAEACAQEKARGTGFARAYAPFVLRRADDPAEAIAYQRVYHGGHFSHGMIRGIADTLHNFDAYQLGKYANTGDIRNVMRLARPKPQTPEEQALFEAAVAGTIPAPYTWEVELSKATTDAEKREVWNDLLESGKLGIFALLRNIRNIMKVGADIETALAQFTPERVRGSGILPFQFYKAYLAVDQAGHSKVAEHLLTALDWLLEGTEKMPGTTLVVADNSGSMNSMQTPGLTNRDLANLMGAMALTLCQAGMAGTFGDTFALADTSPVGTILDNKRAIDACGLTTGHSTNAFRVFKALSEERVWVDRVVVLSDMQCYDGRTASFNKLMKRMHGGMYVGRSMAGELETYRQAVNPKVKVYSINIATQDNTAQFGEDQPVISLAGWSDSIFRFMSAMDAGEDVLKAIKAY